MYGIRGLLLHCMKTERAYYVLSSAVRMLDNVPVDLCPQNRKIFSSFSLYTISQHTQTRTLSVKVWYFIWQFLYRFLTHNLDCYVIFGKLVVLWMRMWMHINGIWITCCYICCNYFVRNLWEALSTPIIWRAKKMQWSTSDEIRVDESWATTRIWVIDIHWLLRTLLLLLVQLRIRI